MTALFEMPLGSETLTKQELTEITGSMRRLDQIAWLDALAWQYVKTKAGEPIVGRLYARLKLAGINASGLSSVDVRGPDMSKVR
tara:strand:+ start:317 stop:568 length:252 start_codon:yes stop_codon:yes gene_type:complete